MSRPGSSMIAMVVLAGVGLFATTSCTNEKAPAKPAITGSVPTAGGGTTTSLLTLGPDTIPTTAPRPTGSVPGSTPGSRPASNTGSTRG